MAAIVFCGDADGGGAPAASFGALLRTSARCSSSSASQPTISSTRARSLPGFQHCGWYHDVIVWPFASSYCLPRRSAPFSIFSLHFLQEERADLASSAISGMVRWSRPLA